MRMSRTISKAVGIASWAGAFAQRARVPPSSDYWFGIAG
jgi:hypothetical protein